MIIESLANYPFEDPGKSTVSFQRSLCTQQPWKAEQTFTPSTGQAGSLSSKTETMAPPPSVSRAGRLTPTSIHSKVTEFLGFYASSLSCNALHMLALPHQLRATPNQVEFGELHKCRFSYVLINSRCQTALMVKLTSRCVCEDVSKQEWHVSSRTAEESPTLRVVDM